VKRLLITGAAGGLGRMLRKRLAPTADILRLSDISDLGTAAANEEIFECDLGDAEAVDRMVEGCDGIVHLGGISVEDRFDKILNANILGMYNLYEAARAHGQPRIVFATSNHTVGYHLQETRLQTDCVTKPDSLYGVSKCFGEQLATMYHSKFGQESALVRIGSCTEQPTNHRMLSSWFSHDDFISLIETVFRVRRLGCPVIWGASNNDEGWWDNSNVAHLGWRPQDNAASFRDQIEAQCERPGPDDPLSKWQGGGFTQSPIYK
jgi:uronate dehydrogenase